MERTDVATRLGVIPLWAPAGALASGKPIVLVITGAWADPDDMLKTPDVVAPTWDAAVMRLPGNGTPWLSETSIPAWAQAVSELIETVLAGRRVVLVGLSVDDVAHRFKLEWRESGGPVVTTPLKKSFGSRFIEQALPGQLQGEARLIFEPTGLICDVNIPIASLQEQVITLK